MEFQSLQDLGYNIPGGAIYAFVFFCFGLMVGSFLNVVIFRVPLGVSIIHPGSRCPGCGRKLGMLENIPLLSWLLQFGRCRGCRAPIHWRYPALELLTGVIWAALGFVFWQIPGEIPERVAFFVAVTWFASYLIAITVIDIDHQIIPDELNFSGIAIALAASAALPRLHFPVDAGGIIPTGELWFAAVDPRLNGLMASGTGAAVGAGSIWLLNLAGTRLFRKTIEKVREREDDEVDSAMGFGDVKLMAFLGAFLGWKEVLLAFLISAFLGSGVGILQKLATGEPAPPGAAKGAVSQLAADLASRWRSGISMMPYGPFLCTGAFLMLLFRQPLLAFFAARFTSGAGAAAP